MKLIIVESPTKTHTISQILGSDYQVEASLGHIRDLATTGKGGLGVDIENNFKAKYVIPADKKDVVKKLKKAMANADEVILATDPDREGEAISWHIAEVLGLPIETTKRLEFHEVTKSAILKAMENPRTIDMNLVASQETRRIIDRIIGFKLSTLLHSKIKSRSAGRVQSVTLKFLVDREKEIQAFQSEEYWTLAGLFNDEKVVATLKGYKDAEKEIKFVDREIETTNKSEEDVNKQKIGSQAEMEAIIAALPKEFKVKDLETKRVKSKSKSPFTTSTMQQAAFSQYHFSTKKTALIAQHLYEGKEINGTFKGLITYMRTDSERLSPEFVESANQYILDNYGEKYLGKIHKEKSSKNIQDGHEAIRPTDLSLTPEVLKPFLTKDELALYKLIYARALSSLMSNKEDDVTTLTLEGNGYLFEAKAYKSVFDGYSKVYGDYETYQKDSELPNLTVGSEIELDKTIPTQHFTKPPLRYTEGRIVRLMEENGIGRPSTYASTIATLEDRKYADVSKGTLTPTEQGILTVEKLSEFFPKFISASYTASMESDLDHVVAGDSSRNKLLKDFCDEFFPMYEHALQNMEKIKDKEVGRLCPMCGRPLIEKHSKYGMFVACSGFPQCKYIEKKEKEYVEGRVCPKCGGRLVVKHSNRGEFVACDNFPKCRYIEGNEKPQVEGGRICPKCGKGHMIVKHTKKGHISFLACSNFPECEYTESLKPQKKQEDEEN